MPKLGAFTFVLHSHLPYARLAGMWPHGEEWVHEGLAETYLPLLSALDDLTREGVDWHLTLGITPILAAQLGDPLIADHFIAYMSDRVTWADEDISRFRAEGADDLAHLAEHERDWHAATLATFRDRFGGDILGAFRTMQEAGNLEIATSAATHGFLPLLSRDSSIHGQLHTGAKASAAMFGTAPKAVWLPECAYRPAVTSTADGVTVRRPGIERFVAEEGLEVFFSETHTVEGGHQSGKASGKMLGPYGTAHPLPVTPLGEHEREARGSTFHPYWVGDAPGQVAVLARNPRTGQQVWSASFGYPGEFAYREFHKKDAVSGMRYWRIGGRELDMGDKPLYDPARAAEQARNHAAHFTHLVEDELGRHHAYTGEFGVISAAYDTELFGHWWFEGVDWLKEVLRRLATSDTVELTTASRIVEQHPPDRVLKLEESSWGNNGDFSTWSNPEVDWMWPLIHQAESRMEGLVARHPNASGNLKRLLNQTARELLLLQSSDWPFLVTTGQAKEYAVERFTGHLERFNRLAELGEQPSGMDPSGLGYLSEIEHLDNPFPLIDYRDWANRQGQDLGV